MAADALYSAQDWMMDGKEVVIVTFLDGPTHSMKGNQIAINGEGDCTDKTLFKNISEECAHQIATVFKTGEPARLKSEIGSAAPNAGLYDLYIERVG